jgi:ribonuclease E
MVVNDSPGEECRIAILEDNHLEELYTERAESATNVGNIYKGRVVNVEPAIQAAFIDYGRGSNGFLHISDLHPRYFPGAERVERVGRKIPRRERPPIQEALKRGDEVLVQVLKEGIGTKGPTLTSYLSIPGRLLVVMPHMDRVGVTRKYEDQEGRREMRKVLDALELPDGFGFIVRTAGVGRTKTELKRDVAYLMRLWKVMEKRIENVGAPCELYTESDLLIRTVRDVLRPAIKAIVVDSASAHARITQFLQVVAPRSAPQVIRYRRSAPIFHAFDIERQIDLIHSREVPLPSGGALVIDQTEALVAIDVNSGKSRSARDSETNAYRTNCEAVDEICRQLRLRDLGGLIIHDLIDMRYQRHRRAIEERFEGNLKRDRARSTILRISEFGLVEMTRQRMRPSMRKTHFVTCPHCDGHGEIKSPESVAADVARHVGFLLDHDRVRRIQIVCSPRVASVLLSRKRRELVRLEDSSGKNIDVHVKDDIALDHVNYYAYDDRNADIVIAHLPAAKQPTLADLEREDQDSADDEEGVVEAAAGKSRRRSRRRRRGGPADATAIALSGGFDEEVEEEDEEATESDEAAGGTKKRRRRRRRRRGEGAEPAEAAEAAPEPEPAEPRPPIRIHELAKEIGVPSREVLARCRSEDESIDVRGHMSSVTAEIADLIRGWFRPEPAAAAEEPPETAEGDDGEEPTPRRRRRRRGGRRRGGRGRGGSDQAEAADEAPADADEAPREPRPDEDGAAPATKKKSRRGRRGGRGRRKSATVEAADETPVAETAPEPAPDDGASEKPAKKKRTRKKKTETKAAEADGDADAPKKKTTKKRKTTKKTTPAEAADTGDAVVEVPAPPKRRTLYGSRRKVSRSALPASEAMDA